MKDYPPKTAAEHSEIVENADPRRLVDEVLREAEALLGDVEEPTEGPTEAPTEDVVIDRVAGLTQGIEDLAAEVADLEASMAADPGVVDMTTSSAEAPPPTIETTPTVDLVASTTEVAATAEAAGGAANRLEQLMSDRLAQEFEDMERSVTEVAVQTAPGSTSTEVMMAAAGANDQAREAEQAAMAALDAEFGADDGSEPRSSPLLRETATNVEAELAGLVPVDDVSDVTAAEMATVHGADDAVGPSGIAVVVDTNEDRDDESTDEDAARDSQEPQESQEPDTESALDAVEAPIPSRTSEPAEEEIPAPVDDELQDIDTMPPASFALRAATKPMRMLPTSVRSLATPLAASLVVWVPIAWSWAIFTPETTPQSASGKALSAGVQVQTPPADARIDSDTTATPSTVDP